MSTVKALRFPVSVEWRGGRLTAASTRSKPEIEVATPPEFRGGAEGLWAPEELLVTATATCYALTLAAIAEKREIPLHSLNVSGTGHLSVRDDNRFGFVAIELDVEIETSAASSRAADSAARHANDICIVSLALDIPVHVGVVVRTPGERLLVHG